MLKHHEESLQIMTEHFQANPEVIAFIFGGSVAKGEERPDSDLDGMLVITDQSYEKRQSDGTLAECIWGKCTYPEGYFDVKYFNKKYLESAVERGSDPTRNSFVKAKVIFTNDPSIEKIVEKIAVYPKDKKHERIKWFHSILRLSSGYFYNDALVSGDQYMLDKCCFETVYAGLRMLFAYNEVFFPSHKNLIKYTERLRYKPDDIVALSKMISEKKDATSRDAFVEAILNFTDWGFDIHSGFGSTYVKIMEQSWQNSDDNVYEL
jgi:predicted nucleotidyltransferase